jgi:hypothetical protein
VETVKVEVEGQAELTKASLSDLKVATGSDLPPTFVANTKHPVSVAHFNLSNEIL